MNGLTILCWTVLCQRKQSFQVLLRNEEIEINFGPQTKLKPLHHAARCQDPYYLEALLRRPEININLETILSADEEFNSGSALHAAITAKNVAAVQILLSQPYIDVWRTQRRVLRPKSAYSRLFLDSIWQPVLEKLLEVASESSVFKSVNDVSQLSLAGLHGWTHVEGIILRIDP